MRELILTSAPHVRSGSQLKNIMYDVALALLPATVWSVYKFGMPALNVILFALASGLAFEALSLYMQRKKNILSITFDGSAIVTALLLALNLPSSSPAWLVITGSFVAIVIAKHTFGGLGYNIFNPALVARVFLLISFPVQMTKWLAPGSFGVDAETIATPLDLIKTEGAAGIEKITSDYTTLDFFLGNTGGSMGEVSAAMLLLGALYLMVRKVITWEVPITILASLFAFTGIFYLVNDAEYASPVLHLLSGGAILGAFFMATDMVTSPMTRKGMIIFGVSIGIITGLIRLFGGYPEGISFAIIIMNAVVPIIDKYTRVKKFGT
ncbi:MAG: RnfABCDGE type electron transport complex subunit D [Leptospirales bacterium]